MKMPSAPERSRTPSWAPSRSSASATSFSWSSSAVRNPHLVYVVSQENDGRRTRRQERPTREQLEHGSARRRFAVEAPPLLVPVSEETTERFHAFFNQYRASLQANRRLLLEKYRFRDVARKVVGVGSVGLRAFVVLLQGRGDPDPLVIQIEEAVSPVLTPYVGRSGYERHGALLHGYLGRGDPFVESVTAFSRAYADQSERDHERLESAVKKGEVAAAFV